MILNHIKLTPCNPKIAKRRVHNITRASIASPPKKPRTGGGGNNDDKNNENNNEKLPDYKCIALNKLFYQSSNMTSEYLMMRVETKFRKLCDIKFIVVEKALVLRVYVEQEVNFSLGTLIYTKASERINSLNLALYVLDAIESYNHESERDVYDINLNVQLNDSRYLYEFASENTEYGNEST
jgi:hypothetical protein